MNIPSGTFKRALAMSASAEILIYKFLAFISRRLTGL